jgi:hypothetical protein
MGSVPNHKRPSGEDPNSTQRKTELLRQEIEAAAKAVAVSCGLPFELEALREAGARGVVDALTKSNHETLGWTLQQHARRYIYERTLERGKRLQREARSVPTAKCIKEALEKFSPQQWETLGASFEEALYPLRSYLDDNKDELVQALGIVAYNRILAAAIQRGMVLSLGWAVKKNRKFVNISNPAYAAH